MAHTTREQTLTIQSWTPEGREEDAAVQTLIRPGEKVELIPPQARMCDMECQKPLAESPIGTCRGLCKVNGDAYGTHANKHLCNTCGYTWA
jgi:hypothetical protein